MRERLFCLIKSKYGTQASFVNAFSSSFPSVKITVDIVSQWSSGKSESYTRFVGELAQFFSVSADYLLFGMDGLSEDESEILGIFKKLEKSGQRQLLGKAYELLDAQRK